MERDLRKYFIISILDAGCLGAKLARNMLSQWKVLGIGAMRCLGCFVRVSRFPPRPWPLTTESRGPDEYDA
jgi:hypothetical protein